MEEFDKMESIFREKFENEGETFYRMRATSDFSYDNPFDSLKVYLQRDIDRLKAQLQSKVEQDSLSLEQDDEAEILSRNSHDKSRMKRLDAKKIKKSTPWYSNLCSFKFCTQYGGLNKGTNVNNQPPASCTDLGMMGYTMSGLYPVQKDGSSEKISIIPLPAIKINMVRSFNHLFIQERKYFGIRFKKIIL